MYEGWTRLLIVFLTHPGVLVPIPVTGVIYLWFRGLWQGLAVLLMHSYSESASWKQLAEMSYWLLLFVMVYIQVAIAMAQIRT